MSVFLEKNLWQKTRGCRTAAMWRPEKGYSMMAVRYAAIFVKKKMASYVNTTSKDDSTAKNSFTK